MKTFSTGIAVLLLFLIAFNPLQAQISSTGYLVCNTSNSAQLATGAHDSLSVSVNVTNVNCFGQSTGSATAVVTGGSNYSYLWSTGSNSDTINGLPAGTYSVTVTANGQTASASVNITQPASALSISATATQTDCNVSNGSAMVSASGGTLNYSYVWSNGGNTSNINGLGAGTYTVTVSDGTGCTASATTIVSTQIPFAVSTSTTDAVCFGQNSGTATATVTGATSAVSFLWSNGESTATLTAIVSGVYNVTVTGGNGCTITATAFVGQAAVIEADVSTTTSICGGSTGSASVTATGGSPGYTYNWSNGATANTITGLAAGNYVVTVRDNNQCAVIATAVVTAPSAATLNINTTNVTCYGQNTGSITVIASGGTTPYSYAWSNGGTSATINNLTAGTYVITVTDGSGCSKTGTGIVTQPAIPFIANATSTASNCGSSTGSVSVTVTGNNGVVTYLWSVNNAATSTVNNLQVGIYTVTATAGGCTATAATPVNNQNGPAIQLLETNPTCFNSNNGLITASVSGGQQPYTYSWSTGAASVTINNLASGTYSLIVTDANNCAGTNFVTLIKPDAITLNPSVTGVNCNGSQTGGIQLNVSGGTSPYTYSWSTSQSTSYIENVVAGSYSVTVSDAQSCSVSGNLIVSQPALLTCTTQTTASGGNNGTATALLSGGTPPYTYVWSNTQTTATATGLTTGIISVTVTDSQGCTATATADVLISGINDAANVINLQVFPNPAGEIVNISADVEASAAIVNITDVTGKIVYSMRENVSGKLNRKIGIHHLNRGIYTIELWADKYIARRKIIVRH